MTDNELIAEFMGLETPFDVNEDGTTIEHPYDISWDWLMPVVEKLSLLREVKQVSISPGKTRIWFADHIAKPLIKSPCKTENDSITECYIAVVEFIKWHNQQKK